jgi:ATP-binding cassette subfamily B protein
MNVMVSPTAAAEAPKPSSERSANWRALADLARLVARSEAPQLKARLIAALVLTLAGKALGVVAPLLLGAAVTGSAPVNRLSAGQGAAVSVGYAFAGLALGWALIRFASAAAPQLRDILFTAVAQAAQRRAATESFTHALGLSLDFHQTKRTGSLSRTLERGSRAVDFLLRVLVFNLAPTALELLLAAAVPRPAYDWRFAQSRWSRW